MCQPRHAKPRLHAPAVNTGPALGVRLVQLIALLARHSPVHAAHAPVPLFYQPASVSVPVEIFMMEQIASSST